MNGRLWCLALLGLGYVCGCAYYSTSATGGAGFRSVAVPLMENESLEPGIQQALTDSLIQGFVADGELRVVDEGRADVVLRGTVVDVKEEPFTYEQRADQYRVTVLLDMQCYDSKNKKILWEEKGMQGYGIYSAAEQREVARRNGLGAAFEMLVQNIMDRTQVGGW